VIHLAASIAAFIFLAIVSIIVLFVALYAAVRMCSWVLLMAMRLEILRVVITQVFVWLIKAGDA
jgi:hypothetical protein